MANKQKLTNSPQCRIAMVAYTFYTSDPRVKRHVNALVEAGWEVDVYALRNPKGSAEDHTNSVRFILPRERSYERQGKGAFLKEYIQFTLACAWRLLRARLCGTRYTLVHVNNMPNFLIFAALPLRITGVPVLLDIHDTMPEIFQDKFGVNKGNWLVRTLQLEERVCMSLADHVITTEHTKWKRLQKTGLRPEKSTVILNLPDSRLFPAYPLKDKDWSNGSTFKVVYHGTLARRLGIDIAVRAIYLLGDKVPGIKMCIIGDGELRPELVRLVEALGIGDRVRLSGGFVSTEDLPALLADADLAVLPSRNTIGTRLMLPTKLLEYARLGIPAITVPTPTITYYFNEPAVHFVPSEDPAALAEKIAHLYAHPELRRATAERAREFFNHFTFESERAAYLDVVAQLMGISRQSTRKIV